MIRALIQLYKSDVMNQHFLTGQAALARFIHAKEILLQKVGETYLPLKLNSIITLVNIVWKELEYEERNNRNQGKSKRQSFH